MDARTQTTILSREMIPVSIKLGKFLPIRGIAPVARHQMLHVIDVHVVRLESLVQRIDEFPKGENLLEFLSRLRRRFLVVEQSNVVHFPRLLRCSSPNSPMQAIDFVAGATLKRSTRPVNHVNQRRMQHRWRREAKRVTPCRDCLFERLTARLSRLTLFLPAYSSYRSSTRWSQRLICACPLLQPERRRHFPNFSPRRSSLSPAPRVCAVTFHRRIVAIVVSSGQISNSFVCFRRRVQWLSYTYSPQVD